MCLLIHVPHVVADPTLNAHTAVRKVLGVRVDRDDLAVTGCARTAPAAECSQSPSKVTCPACRQYAADRHAARAMYAARLAGTHAETSDAHAMLYRQAERHQGYANMFRGPVLSGDGPLGGRTEREV